MRLVPLLLLLLLAAVPAAGDDAPPAPDKPLTPDEAAQQVQAAFAAGDEEAVRARARQDEPDPWRVADALVARGHHDAAAAFARATPRKAVEALAAYVESRRGSSDALGRAAVDAMNKALAARAWKEALDATAALAGDVQPERLRTVVLLRLARGRGLALSGLRRLKESATLLNAAAVAAAKLGWYASAVEGYQMAGLSASSGGDWAGALAAWQSSLALSRLLGDERREARTLLDSVAKAQVRLGDDAGASESYTEAARLFRKHDAKLPLAMALFNAGDAQQRRGRLGEALERYNEALELSRTLRQKRGIAFILNSSALVLRKLGSYELALERCAEARTIFEAAKDRRGVALVLSNLGNIRQRLGDYPEALKLHTLALDRFRALEHTRGIASTLNNVGNVQLRLGNYADAIARYKEALELFRGFANQRGAATALSNLGSVERNQGHLEDARGHYAEALTIFRALPDQAGIASTLNELGTLESRYQENGSLALVHYEEALGLFTELDNKPGIATVLNNIGNVHERTGAFEKAYEAYDRALGLLKEAPNPATQVTVLWSLAYLRFRQGRPKEAAALARQGIEMVSDLAEGLAEGEGASARDVFGDLFDVGVRASLAADDTATQLWMFEQGRADTLRKGLASRSALEAAVIPEALRLELAKAQGEERLAVTAYRQAAETRRLADVQKARKAMNAAQEAVRLATDRIQREAKSAAQLVLPEADDLKTISGHMAPGEVLVAYGLTDGDAVALVVSRAGARMVPLGPSKALRDAALALPASDRRLKTKVVLATADVLKKLLVVPLALGKDVKRVLVSPIGVLGYVPFAMLFTEQEVAYVPSGTTYGLLLAQGSARGTKVLALGNPDYSTHATRLAALPATEEEIQTIGTTRLVQAQASETALQPALSKETRWRAVHFACHGLVDPERPWRSSLALTADGENDGFLTCLEVFRMKIPTDLVVLSACETGKGRIFKTEGIVGLTRAFMFAGAPRVICSLWKVDDEATLALMLKFYELWNPDGDAPGRGTAEALREAQAFVRGHEKWAHPYFWAAWVLWGLPD